MNNQTQINLIRERHANRLINLAFDCLIGRQPSEANLRRFSGSLQNHADPSVIFSQLRMLPLSDTGAAEPKHEKTIRFPKTTHLDLKPTHASNSFEQNTTSLRPPQKATQARSFTLHPPDAFGGEIYTAVRKTVCALNT